MKSNEDSSLMLNYQKDRNVSAINYLQNSMKFKKEYPKYMLKYANNIQNNLVSAGIGNRGIKIRNSTPDAADRYYPDGSLSDYYAVNHRGKTAGLPAIIVEHCFISSAYDRNNFLSNENSLMRMGVADARGIAETFGLSR